MRNITIFILLLGFLIPGPTLAQEEDPPITEETLKAEALGLADVLNKGMDLTVSGRCRRMMST